MSPLEARHSFSSRLAGHLPFDFHFGSPPRAGRQGKIDPMDRSPHPFETFGGAAAACAGPMPLELSTKPTQQL
jgi:hypothetical protein